MDFDKEYRSLHVACEAAVGNGSLKAFGRLFSNGAIFLAPNQDALHGPDAIVADYASSLGDDYTVNMEIEDMQDCRDFCFGTGKFHHDGGSGKWSLVLKRQPDRSLRIHRLCCN